MWEVTAHLELYRSISRNKFSSSEKEAYKLLLSIFPFYQTQFPLQDSWGAKHLGHSRSRAGFTPNFWVHRKSPSDVWVSTPTGLFLKKTDRAVFPDNRPTPSGATPRLRAVVHTSMDLMSVPFQQCDMTDIAVTDLLPDSSLKLDTIQLTAHLCWEQRRRWAIVYKIDLLLLTKKQNKLAKILFSPK